MVVNVAIGKPATQSSMSQWSSELGAGGAVTGTISSPFGFHTDLEAGPWWMVDLETTYPIERIVIHNRLDMCFERASSCKVEISLDGLYWRLVHAGVAHFLGGWVGPPLTLPLGSRILARFVRISLTEREMLHLAQVEVFAHIGFRLKDRYGLQKISLEGDYSTPASAEKNRAKLAYGVEGKDLTETDVEIVGLQPVSFGRLGNQLIQLMNATIMARRLGLRYVVVLNQGLIQLPAPSEHDGITYISEIAQATDAGRFLVGDFFFPEVLSPVIDDASGEERQRIVTEIVRPHMMQAFPSLQDEKHADELTVHFRSGDIFRDTHAAAGYTQPPLGFYTLVVRHLLRQRAITRVRLVFEDRLNPCIDAFIAFLKSLKIPYRVQNGSLAEDLTALIDAPNLVFGHGTFGVAVCLLSRSVSRLFFFDSLYYGYYQGIPSIGTTIFIRDRQGGYMKNGDWQNTSEQRKLMLDYPESALEVINDISGS
jgi:hypothetical protein